MNKDETLEFAKKYIADVISFFGENVDPVVSLRDDVIEISVTTVTSNSVLIGRNAETLRSLQFLLSTILRNKNAEIQRVNLDIADYKQQRAERLASQVKEWAAVVLETGTPRTEPLNAADRRIVHHVVSEIEGLKTVSEGEGRERTITILKV